MIKKILFLIIAASMFSCAGTQKVDTKPAKPTGKEALIGWNDSDTYTIKAQGKNLEKAKDKAINKIFREIVNIRVLKKSPYSDIKNIMEEFNDPIKNGKVILENQIQDGVEILFQIQDKDLKKKFERN